MNQLRKAASLALVASVGFAAGWAIEHARARNAAPIIQEHRSQKEQHAAPTECGEDTPDDLWHTARIFDYRPTTKSYTVEWQACGADVMSGRVRVMDADMRKVFYQYDDAQILRAEEIDLFGETASQLLIVTDSGGTNDETDWHVLSEANGQLHEWTWPDYDSPAEKLLREDEDFCCKEWNFHLRGHELVLARGIYRKNLRDGNCCPSRGGVLVWLRPIRDGFLVRKVQRIGKPEYYRWWSSPFCSKCTLIAP